MWDQTELWWPSWFIAFNYEAKWLNIPCMSAFLLILYSVEANLLSFCKNLLKMFVFYEVFYVFSVILCILCFFAQFISINFVTLNIAMIRWNNCWQWIKCWIFFNIFFYFEYNAWNVLFYWMCEKSAAYFSYNFFIMRKTDGCYIICVIGYSV